jgi:hypothetical protein
MEAPENKQRYFTDDAIRIDDYIDGDDVFALSKQRTPCATTK